MLVCGLREKITTVATIAILLVIFIISEDPVQRIQNPKPQPQPRYPVPTDNSKFRGNDDFSSNKPAKPNNSKYSQDDYYILTNNTVIHLWIDVPNSFPWRKCLHEYNEMMFTYSCSLYSYKQALTVRTLEQGDGTRFRLILGTGDGARCVEPDHLQGQGDERMVSGS